MAKKEESAGKKPRISRRIQGCTEKERTFGQTYVATHSQCAAGRSIGLKNPRRDSHNYLSRRPHLQKYVAELQRKTEEKSIEKAADRLSIFKDLADKRLEELLGSQRLNDEHMALLAGLGRTKAGIEIIKEKGLADQPSDGTQKIATPDLLRAIDIGYKRSDAYPKTATQQQINLQNNIINPPQIYRAPWVKTPQPLQPQQPILEASNDNTEG